MTPERPSDLGEVGPVEQRHLWRPSALQVVVVLDAVAPVVDDDDDEVKLVSHRRGELRERHCEAAVSDNGYDRMAAASGGGTHRGRETKADGPKADRDGEVPRTWNLEVPNRSDHEPAPIAHHGAFTWQQLVHPRYHGS